MGNRLKELIDGLDMSADEFAKLFSINRSSVYRYTGGNKNETRDIPIDLAIDICERFNISLDWLVGNENAYKYRDNTTDALLSIYNSLSVQGKQELFSYATFLKGRDTNE